MDIKQIVKLNNQFYQLISDDFSRTRQKPWEGWGIVVENINKYFEEEGRISEKNKDNKCGEKGRENNFNKSILDVGCGNGRFCEYLSKYFKNFSYTGIDINNDLLLEGKEKCKKIQNVKCKFIKKDIFLDISSVKGAYNVICSFGVTHHLPNTDFRDKWFQSLVDLSHKNSEPSMIVLTFWDFTKMPGDYLVSWGERVDIPRYCHKYSNKEILNISNIFKQNGFKLIDKYNSDNKNLYLIFGKI